MFKLILPSLLLMSCTASDEPETKKASFNLKEACASSEYYAVKGEPTTWNATIEWKSQDGETHKNVVAITWESQGFKLPCGYGVQGDPKPIFTINYK